MKKLFNWFLAEGFVVNDDFDKEIKNPNVNYRYDVFQNTSHYSLVAEAIPSAFYFIFIKYNCPIWIISAIRYCYFKTTWKFGINRHFFASF